MPSGPSPTTISCGSSSSAQKGEELQAPPGPSAKVRNPEDTPKLFRRSDPEGGRMSGSTYLGSTFNPGVISAFQATYSLGKVQRNRPRSHSNPAAAAHRHDFDNPDGEIGEESDDSVCWQDEQNEQEFETVAPGNVPDDSVPQVTSLPSSSSSASACASTSASPMSRNYTPQSLPMPMPTAMPTAMPTTMTTTMSLQYTRTSSASTMASIKGDKGDKDKHDHIYLSMTTLTAQQLKQHCQKHGFSTNGSKPQMNQRIRNALPYLRPR